MKIYEAVSAGKRPPGRPRPHRNDIMKRDVPEVGINRTGCEQLSTGRSGKALRRRLKYYKYCCFVGSKD